MAHINNDAAINFGTVAGSTVTISQYRATFAAGTSNAVSTGWIALAASRTLMRGDKMQIPAGALDIELPRGAFPNDLAEEALSALLSVKTSTVRVELGHSSSEVSDSGYTEQNAVFSAEA